MPENLTAKDHPAFQYDPDYSWEKIPKWSFKVPRQKMQVPDWRIYKIEGIRELEHVQEVLAAQGLKDPWLRNEVWRYPPLYERNVVPAYGRFLFGVKAKGIKYGFSAAVVVCTLQWLYYKKRYGDYPPHISTLYHEVISPRHHGHNEHH